MHDQEAERNNIWAAGRASAKRCRPGRPCELDEEAIIAHATETMERLKGYA